MYFLNYFSIWTSIFQEQVIKSVLIKIETKTIDMI